MPGSDLAGEAVAASPPLAVPPGGGTCRALILTVIGGGCAKRRQLAHRLAVGLHLRSHRAQTSTVDAWGAKRSTFLSSLDQSGGGLSPLRRPWPASHPTTS